MEFSKSNAQDLVKSYALEAMGKLRFDGMMRLSVGVDVGLTGAVSMLNDQGKLLLMRDMPTLQVSKAKGVSNEINIYELVMK